jgi:hypothetical protein
MRPQLVVTGMFILLAGIVAIAISAAMAPPSPAFTWSSALVSGGVGVTSFGSAQGIMMAGGAICILGGALAAAAGVMNYIKAFLATSLLGLVGGAILLYGGSLGSPYASALSIDQWLNNANNAPNQQTAADLFALVVFENCCRPNGWADQGPFGACGVSCPSAQSGEFYETTLQSLNADGQFNGSLLCSCFPSSSAYAAMSAIVTPQLCTTLSKLTTPIDGSELFPTTAYTISQVEQKQYPSSVFTVYPVVGWYRGPETAPANVTGTEALGGGCGFGYPKGISFVFEEYYNNVVAEWFTATSALGGIAIAAVVCGWVAAYCVYRADMEYAGTGMSSPKYDQPLVPAMQSASSFTMPSSNFPGGAGLYSPSSDPMMVPPSQLQPLPGEQLDQNLLAALQVFYRTNEPSKSQDEIVKLTYWTGRHGVNELNSRLRQKYGVDLSSVSNAPQPSARRAENVDYMDALTKFYRQTDPLKPRREIEEINAWAIKNGPAALNANLGKKYGRDLSSI